MHHAIRLRANDSLDKQATESQGDTVHILEVLYGFRPFYPVVLQVALSATVHTVLQNFRPLGGRLVDSTAEQADL
jgi:hypothetical protein